MKYSILSLILMSGLASAAIDCLPAVGEAKEQAKKATKPALILWHGSDWLPKGTTKALTTSWQKLHEAGLPVVLGQFDDTTGLERELRLKVLPVAEYDLPAAVMLLPDGSYYTTLTKDQICTPDSLKKATGQALAEMAEFQKLRAKAQSTPGVEGARAAGQALLLRPYGQIHRHKDLTDIIRKKDPKNETGYLDAFCATHEAVWKELNGILEANGKKGKNRDFAGAIARTEKALQCPDMPAEARQMWLSAQSYVMRDRIYTMGEKDFSELLALYKRIEALGPETDYGRGAAFFQRYHTEGEEITIPYNYYDHRMVAYDVKKVWVKEITADIQGPGTYVFELLPESRGKMKVRNYRLYMNGQLIQTVDKEGMAAELTIPEHPKYSCFEVRADVTAQHMNLDITGRIRVRKK